MLVVRVSVEVFTGVLCRSVWLSPQGFFPQSAWSFNVGLCVYEVGSRLECFTGQV